MAGKRGHIRYDNDLAPGHGRAADALPHRDPRTGWLALEGPDDQHIVAQEIKSRPINIGQSAEDKRRRVGRAR